jgi:hypothetical protein
VESDFIQPFQNRFQQNTRKELHQPLITFADWPALPGNCRLGLRAVTMRFLVTLPKIAGSPRMKNRQTARMRQ